MSLRSRKDLGDDLTELVDALSEYCTNRGAVYLAVQALAEDEEASLEVGAEISNEFVAHMAEFRIDAQPAPH